LAYHDSISKGISDLEQIAKADLLAVMFFANVWFMVMLKAFGGQKALPAGAGSLASPLGS